MAQCKGKSTDSKTWLGCYSRRCEGELPRTELKCKYCSLPLCPIHAWGITEQPDPLLDCKDYECPYCHRLHCGDCLRDDFIRVAQMAKGWLLLAMGVYLLCAGMLIAGHYSDPGSG